MPLLIAASVLCVLFALIAPIVCSLSGRRQT